ncbi:hypothetical protein BE21_00805 [Sorangium cellulosum]|uniref:Uncharacterized protein n=1 Tax=Sorangium cellulosum TaxID=56 RepID=A0A150U3R3_SORCE|nr:hypothetical protein BE21_00805 [Sorangium cellulosum]
MLRSDTIVSSRTARRAVVLGRSLLGRLVAAALVTAASDAEACTLLSCRAETALARVYDVIRALATPECLTPGHIPNTVDILDDETLNAGAFYDQVNGKPRIAVNRGLLDLHDALSYYASAAASTRVKATADLLLFKAKSPYGPLGSYAPMSDWQNQATPYSWHSSFHARAAFVLAHELAHHCLGHNDANLNPLPPLRAAAGNVLKNWRPLIDLGHVSGSSSSSIQMETAADTWAIGLLMKYKDSILLDPEATASAIAEFAILDYAAGRAPAGSGAEQWSHPMGDARFQGAWYAMYDKVKGVPFLKDIHYIVLCLNSYPKIDILERFAAGQEICQTQPPAVRFHMSIAEQSAGSVKKRLQPSALAEVSEGNAAPFEPEPVLIPQKIPLRPVSLGRLARVAARPLRLSADAVPLSIDADGDLSLMIRRADDSKDAVREVPLVRTAPGAQFHWSVMVDREASYALKLAPKQTGRGKLEVRVGDAPVLRLDVPGGDALSLSQPREGVESSGGELVFRIEKLARQGEEE